MQHFLHFSGEGLCVFLIGHPGSNGLSVGSRLLLSFIMIRHLSAKAEIDPYVNRGLCSVKGAGTSYE